MLDIQIIPCLSDNYAYLLRDTESGNTAVVDTPEAAPILAALQERDLSLDYILNTHHHWDHTGGNVEIKKATDCQIVGAQVDRNRIPGIDIALAEGELFELGTSRAKVLEIPGHTLGHIAFWFEESEALFPGDTLFCIGCGRVFEGTFEQMWSSLDKLRQLPDETKIYCGHEYTVKNAEFAVSIDPDNQELQERLRSAQALRSRGEPTIPSAMAEERATNPFLRTEQPEIGRTLGLTDANPLEVFAAIRQRKDRF